MRHGFLPLLLPLASPFTKPSATDEAISFFYITTVFELYPLSFGRTGDAIRSRPVAQGDPTIASIAAVAVSAQGRPQRLRQAIAALPEQTAQD
jgi:hypothetical protein